MVKIKEVTATANYAWSPNDVDSIYMAAGTAAQQLDASFSSNAKIEIYSIDFTSNELTAPCIGQIDTTNRFQKVVWGSSSGDADKPKGYLVCGTDKGGLEVYDPHKIINNEEDCLVWSVTKHTGPVRSLDFNIHQKNLIASGANDSEIFIWDLNNQASPMTPGVKTQPASAVNSLAWNKQVQHILASTTALSSGPSCVVWDLKKNEPVIKVHDPSGRMQCSDVAWHPEVATQLVLSSEDDHLPIVQLWDLRFAASPVKVFNEHKKGVLSVAWSSHDPDLVLSCSKTNEIFCWNPNNEPIEVVYDLTTNSQWSFDIQWCPRDPNIISSGSFDGQISIYSLMTGGFQADSSVSNRQRDALAESFGSNFGSSLPVVQDTPKKIVGKPLKNPPKWMKSSCGVSFAFGGRLVSYGKDEKNVYISQVVTEKKLLKRSEELRAALVSDETCLAYCKKKVESAASELEENIWNFLLVNFENEPRKKYLELLGYNTKDLKAKFEDHLKSGLIDEEVAKEVDDLQIIGEDNEVEEVEEMKEEVEIEDQHLTIPLDDGDVDSLISQALLVGDYQAAVDLCVHDHRMADAIVIAIAGGKELLEKTQQHYLETSKSKISKLLSAVVTKDWKKIVTTCDVTNWKEAFACLLTFASDAEFKTLCDKLGSRLEAEPSLRHNACLCYVCSGNVEKLTSCWEAIRGSESVASDNSAQDFIEKIMVQIRLLSRSDDVTNVVGTLTAEKLAQYASVLADQGSFDVAMEVLPANCDKPAVKVLRDRLHHLQDVEQPQEQTNQSDQATNQATNQAYQATNQGYQATSQGYQATSQGYQATSQGYQATSQGYQATSQGYQATSQQQPQVNPYSAKRHMGRNQYANVQQAPVATNFFTPAPVARTPNSLYNPQQPLQQPLNQQKPLQQPLQQPLNQQQPLQQPLNQQQPSVNSTYNGYTNMASKPGLVMTSQPPLSGAGDPVLTSSAPGRRATPGWNDPPQLDPNRVPKNKKQPVNKPQFSLPDNIMTPTAQQQQPLPGLGQPYLMQPHLQQPPTTGQQAMPTMQKMTNDFELIEDDINQPNQAANTASVPTRALRAAPKAPIPQEHQILQDTILELIQKCRESTTNPQHKRKLDDCSKRLDFLYDKLRAQTLSAPILTGLHQVIHSIQTRDYETSINQYTEIVSKSNFSEVSAFMTGLKMLLQIAQQLRV